MFPDGYNIQPGGDERPPMSEEERKKLSERMKGNKFRLGKVTSDETKNLLSQLNRGKILSADHKKKIAKSHFGVQPTYEVRRKLSVAKKGRPLSVEHRLKISESNRGVKRSEETKRRMVEAWKKRKQRASDQESKHRRRAG
jgi:hypothetical protein